MSFQLFTQFSSSRFYQGGSNAFEKVFLQRPQTAFRRALFPFVMGLLFSWGFQPSNHLIIAFAALIAFYRHFEKKMRFSDQGAFFLGYWFGFGFFFGGLHWIAYALHVDWLRYAILVPLAAGAIPGILAIGLGCATWGAGRLMFDNRLAALLAFAIIWSVFEWIKSHLLTGFPWMNLAEIWLSGDVIIQNLAFMGPFALGLVTLILFIALYVILFFEGSHRFPAFVVFLTLGTGLLVMGSDHLRRHPTTFHEGFEIVLVQPNILQTHKWEDAYLRANVDTLVRLSLQSRIRPEAGSVPKPKLYLWPEASVPYQVTSQGSFARYLSQVLDPQDLLILGAPRRDTVPIPHHYNSLVILEPQGRVAGTYDKAHLVPFGEYVPYKDLLPDAIQTLAPGDFQYSKGQGLETMGAGDFPTFSPLICYEAIFTQEVIAPTSLRPQWMLNLTNDGWYLDSSGIYQHLHLTRMRAIEEGMPLVRVVYRGISAVFDANGRMTATIPFDRAEGLVTSLPKPLPKGTLYAAHGNLFYAFLLFFCILNVIGLILYSRHRRSTHQQEIYEDGRY